MDYSQIPFKMIISKEKKLIICVFPRLHHPGPPTNAKPWPDEKSYSPVALAPKSTQQFFQWQRSRASQRSKSWFPLWVTSPNKRAPLAEFCGFDKKNRWNCYRKKKGECVKEKSLEKDIKWNWKRTWRDLRSSVWCCWFGPNGCLWDVSGGAGGQTKHFRL